MSEPSSPAPSSADAVTLTLRPIGYIRSGKAVKFQAKHQPDERDAETNFLELLPGENFEQALADLAAFDRVWLVWWFHRNSTWRPQVIPPRGPQRRRGVFATRSPHRPNAVGLTPVRLLGIEGRVLRLGACDLVEGTPVFDIKPYVPAYDSFPDSRAGWIDEVDALHAAPPAYAVDFAPFAIEQADWLRAGWGIDFLARVAELLGRDPSPHRTRRIRRTDTGFELGCGAWRALFTVEAGEAPRVLVRELGPAYPWSMLRRENTERVPDFDAQVAFLTRWPESELPLKPGREERADLADS